MKTTRIVSAFFLAAMALMSGCASTDSRSTSSYPGAAYGTIDAIENDHVSRYWSIMPLLVSHTLRRIYDSKLHQGVKT